MLANYLKIAVKVLLRRKFFTAISLFGTSFTLVVLMVATAILDHMVAPLPPETRQDRTLGVYSARMLGEHFGVHTQPGFALLDRYVRNLPGVERMSILSSGGLVSSYLNGSRIQSSLKRTDGEFWKILGFDFLEGGPFSPDDVEKARFVAVINATTRRRFFGDAPALGHTIEAGGQRFQVVGVVPDVPELRTVPFADIWVPLTTARSDTYRRELMGGFAAIFLVGSTADFPLIKEAFRTRMKTVDLPRDFQRMIAVPETALEHAANSLVGGADQIVHARGSLAGSLDREAGDVSLARFWAAAGLLTLIFMLLPTLNLVNLSVSRILERASEIGVRKAFGASSRTLVGQFVVENVVLTLLGGAVGFVLSRLVLEALGESGLLTYTRFGMNGRVFLYGLALAVFFGVLSGAYPAWRMSRLHAVEALKGERAMTLHLFKLIWNRKGTNVLLMVEIFFSFLVLFAVTTLGLFYVDNWRQPLGYRWDHVWCVNVHFNIGAKFEGWTDEAAQTFRRLEDSVAEFGDVEAAAAASRAPYQNWSWITGYSVDGKVFLYEVEQVSDRFQVVLGLETVRGRFFSREDDGAAFKPAVINERFARRVFGDQDPLGKIVPHDKDATQPEMRVTGVVREYRPQGEFAPPFDHVLVRQTGASAWPAFPPQLLLLKVRPGTPAAFEEKLLQRLHAVAPDWSFTVKPLAEMREENHRQRLAPMTAFALIAGFLLLMVALGLTGVLWQNVTQRTREIGLRRAKGASAGAIHAQILGELAVITSLAVAAGTVVVVQFPLLDLLGFVRPGVFAESLAVSVATLYVLTVMCGLYPSRLATRLRPAEALRYE